MNRPSNTLQIIDGSRFTAAHAVLARNRLVEKVLRDRERGERLQAIAKRHNLSYNEVLVAIEEAARQRVEAARQDGFRAGLRAARFGGTPPSSTGGAVGRRAA